MRFELQKLASVYTTPKMYEMHLARQASRIISLYGFGAAEIAMDRYCKQHYRLPLRLMCIRILMSAKVMTVDNSYFAIIADKNLEKIARLITYGNGIMNGSSILTDAFLRVK